MRRSLLISVSVLALAPGAACGSDCKGTGSAGVGITVVNASNQHLCDADVTIADGDYTEHLQVTPATSAEPCTYYGAYERPGTYTVTVTGAGASANDSSATVAKVNVRPASCTGVGLNRSTVQL